VHASFLQIIRLSFDLHAYSTMASSRISLNICFAAIMAWKAFYKEGIAARHACDWKPHHG
jgi:hypothetical protein